MEIVAATAVNPPRFSMMDEDDSPDNFGRMTLTDAVRKVLPLILNLETATMRAIEKATGLAERKARWHVGQLVKHGHLVRKGMGRGTHYVAPAPATSSPASGV